MMEKEINLSKGYAQEKLGNAITSISDIVEMFNRGTIIINKNNDIQKSYEEECKKNNKKVLDPNIEESFFVDYLNYALNDILKILSFATDTKWETEDSEIIIERGKEGLKEVKHKYGLK